MRDSLRILLAILLLGSPLMGDFIHFPLFAAALGALLAHDGLSGRAVVRSVIFLVVAEFLWAIPFGVLSLAYIGMVLVLRSLESGVAVAPLSRQRDWSLIPLIRAVVLGWFLSLVMIFFSVTVQSVIYHRGSLVGLASSAYHPIGQVIGLTGVAVGLMLIVLHRIDVPFRRKIVFGI